MRYLIYETVNSKFVLPLGRSTLRKKETISVMEKSRGKEKYSFQKAGNLVHLSFYFFLLYYLSFFNW